MYLDKQEATLTVNMLFGSVTNCLFAAIRS